MDHSDGDRRVRFAAHNALVGRSVRVRLRHDDTFMSGVLYGVDPERGDVALMLPPTPPAAIVEVKIILGHAVQSVETDVTMDNCTLESIRADMLASSLAVQPKQPAIISKEVRQARAQQLCEFLDERFIPYAPSAGNAGQDAIAVLGGAATLRFPFGADSIECTNEQILRRLQTLMAGFQLYEE